jgi:3-methylcrotonyl-CoA carboxylase beta subunit
VLQSQLEPTLACDEAARRNRDVNLSLFAEIRSIRAAIEGSDDEVRRKDRSSRKLTVRERIDLLRDDGGEVLDVGLFAGWSMPYGRVPNASNAVVVTKIAGETCVVSANIWTFKGGTLYPIGVKKQLRAQEISMENRLPCIYLVDSGGAFLPLQAEVFPDRYHGGRVFRNQANLSSMGIPQISVVCGSCTAGGAYIPTMSDEAVIVKGIGSLYLAGPPLVKAATGETITTEELGGADIHCGVSGCTDHYVESEEEGFHVTRRIISSLNLSRRRREREEAVEPPLCSTSEESFASLLPPSLSHGQWPALEIIARVVDGSRFHPFKEKYGPTLHAGFARINGRLVGILASDGELTATAATKGTHFVRLCTFRDIPIVFFQNTPSDLEYLAPGGNEGLTVKSRAQMMSAVACATVPKITVVVGGGYGPSSFAMVRLFFTSSTNICALLVWHTVCICSENKVREKEQLC